MALSDEHERLIDRTYCFRNVGYKWMVGNSALEINEDDYNFYLAGRKYKGTPGLYELLFMQHAEMYNKHDLREYKSVVKDTNSHKLYH